jgi:hypothetical protein
MGNGASLGEARGRITIETADLDRAAQSARTAARQIEQALGGISTGTQRAERSIQSLSSSLSQLGGAFGLVTGAAAVAAIGRFALQADATATAYKRQEVAALSLAGSQGKLNALLVTYDQVTGGAVDKAQALSDVTMLQAIGFADTTQELERFVTAARGISVATGRPLEFVIQQLQLAIANQSELRLDQIGLGIDEVKNKVSELKTANSGLSDAMAYQNAILTVAERKFGDLVKSQEAQATGAEKARKAWADLSLAIGEAFGPAFGGALSGAASQIDGVRQNVQALAADLERVGAILAAIRSGDWSAYIQASITLGNSVLGRTPLSQQMGAGADIARPTIRPGIDGPRPDDPRAGERRAAQLDFQRQIADIERSANEQRLDATRSYESQRSQTIADYERSIAREAEDFARQRVRAQQELMRQIADIEDEGRRNAARWASDLAERISELSADSGERIAEAQENTNKRIAEIEEDYQRNRERAERDHRDRLFDAAARLDAVAVFNEQRNFKRQQQDADEAHREQLDKLNEQLSERIQDEQENLQERIDQENRAHARRLADAKDADDRRIADMREDFARRQAEEDADRAVRLRRMAEDHAAQLAQQAAAQAERLAQIARHEAEERKAAEDAHLKEMEQLGVVLSKGWLLVQKSIEAAMLKEYEDFKKKLKEQFTQPRQDRFGNLIDQPYMPEFASGGWVNRTGPAMVHAGELILNRQQAAMRSGTTLNLSDGAIVVYGTPGMSPDDIARAVRGELVSVLREVS